ncbi:hypothetical protein P879_01909 [Paragonimus westermani]|uniref:Histone-lysine N-methyltransferase PRDM9 n=1 Tax=Paragonimus westermani TaxID=34504 RepID=A0A8T0DUR3_9TREM|nr:hypothetical protein P879_01909 [Paragonimus westermani]
MPMRLGLSKVEELRRRRVLENLDQLKRLTGIPPEKENVIKKLYGIEEKKAPQERPKRNPNEQTRRLRSHSTIDDSNPTAPKKLGKVKKSRAISLEYSDSGSDWLSSGDEWTPDTHSTDLETGHGFGRLSKLKNPKAQLVCSQKGICKGGVMKVTPTEEGRRYPLREKKPANYSTVTQIPEDDRFLYCYVCNVSVIDGCLEHPIEWVQNNPITLCDAAKDHEVYFQRRKCVCGTPYYLHASCTAPRDWVRVWKSGIHGAGFGVWANKDIKCGTTFGPYGGVVVNLDDMEDDEFTRRSRGGYAWLVRNNLGGVKSHLVDARNPLRSNWLRFVNCARCDEEQNLVTIQYRGKIYYRACQDITSGSELLTYYGTEFAAELESWCGSRSPTISLCGAELVERQNHESNSTKPVSKRTSYVCEFCGKNFSYNGHLRLHVDTIHLKRTSYVCEFCGRNFSYNGNLRLHVDTIHLKRTSYVCEFCGKNFTQNGNLRRHVDTIHLKKANSSKNREDAE